MDALTHIGLLLVMTADGAQRGELVYDELRLFDRAPGQSSRTIRPRSPTAGRCPTIWSCGAIASWQKFVAVAPPSEDRDRVAKQIAAAKAAPPKRQDD